MAPRPDGNDAQHDIDHLETRQKTVVLVAALVKTLDQILPDRWCPGGLTDGLISGLVAIAKFHGAPLDWLINGIKAEWDEPHQVKAQAADLSQVN